MNRFLDESKDVIWNLGSTGYCDRLRIQPTLARIIDALKPQTEGRGDFLIKSALKGVLIEAIQAGRLRLVYDTVGTLLGIGTTPVDEDVTSVAPRHTRSNGSRAS